MIKINISESAIEEIFDFVGIPYEKTWGSDEVIYDLRKKRGFERKKIGQANSNTRDTPSGRFTDTGNFYGGENLFSIGVDGEVIIGSGENACNVELSMIEDILGRYYESKEKEHKEMSRPNGSADYGTTINLNDNIVLNNQ